ncbi:uncharacterized protein N7482_006745 [Penicillium canariense]|uniref:CENP-V/GFA domain-containing protein n=1 Tax=Penicillium canariense TaxID=189055 RepID=A0A9W9HY56_9EURO|nr:uncharacterized protein N7482_006745 [Penicillium canariense]KAJ5159741.1 hypothetical protein N7482_006745 [Penicillium canariense]
MPSGSCFCQKLKYEFTGEPEGVAICHCLSCQKISGSTNTLNLIIPVDRVHFTVGSPKTCTESHEIGMKITLHFCGNCGGVLYKTADLDMFAGKAVVQIGTLDDATAIKQAKPDMELWTKYRAPWLPSLEGVVQKTEF